MSFEHGIVVFFRQILPDNTLARGVHTNGRNVQIRSQFAHIEDYVITDAQGQLCGVYPRDWVACILPIIPVPEEKPNVTN